MAESNMAISAKLHIPLEKAETWPRISGAHSELHHPLFVICRVRNPSKLPLEMTKRHLLCMLLSSSTHSFGVSHHSLTSAPGYRSLWSRSPYCSWPAALQTVPRGSALVFGSYLCFCYSTETGFANSGLAPHKLMPMPGVHKPFQRMRTDRIRIYQSR